MKARKAGGPLKAPEGGTGKAPRVLLVKGVFNDPGIRQVGHPLGIMSLAAVLRRDFGHRIKRSVHCHLILSSSAWRPHDGGDRRGSTRELLNSGDRTCQHDRAARGLKDAGGARSAEARQTDRGTPKGSLSTPARAVRKVL